MNWREYPQSEVDPVTGRDDHDLYFSDERKAILRNLPQESMRNQIRENLKMKYKDYSVLGIVKDLDEKLKVFAGAVETSGGDVHDLKQKWQTIINIEEDGDDKILAELDEKYSGDLLDLMAMFNY